MKITIANYGVGNLYSIRQALEKKGATVKIVTDMKDLLDAQCIVFPGVGAFDSTIEKLLPYRDEICERLTSGVPALGICIGAQILFKSSEEGNFPGLGLYDGTVTKLDAKLIPHMGWNDVVSSDPLLDTINDRFFYFAHSYRGMTNGEVVIGNTEYEGKTFPSFFRYKNTYGTQFHPEKSSESGLKLIDNFIKFAEDNI